MCESRWPKKILDWKPPFRRKRVRLPEEWEKQVKNDMLRRDHDWRDKEAWRRGCERRPAVELID
nr:unnamed protein product [Callosobruchus chinensis]